MNAIPKLRFGDFKLGYERAVLGAGISLQSGFAFSSELFSSDGLKLVTPKNFTKFGYACFDPSNTKYTTEIVSKKYKCGEGDLLLLLTDLTPSCELLGRPMELRKSDGTVLLNQRIVRIDVKEECYDASFLKQFFLSERYRKRIVETASGSTVRHSSNKIINSIKIDRPALSEQKKIADFLWAVDEKVRLLRARHDHLETYKKGVMQKIFTQDIRFKADDGSEFPDWKATTFGDVFEFKRTNNFSRANLNYTTGEVKNIHYGDIHTKLNSRFKISQSEIPYVNASESIESFNKDDFCRVGDIVIADASEDYNDIGKAIELIELEEVPLLAGLHTYLARPKPNKSHLGFFGFLMQSYPIRLQIMKLAQGISVLGISKTNLAKVRFNFPHPDEQQKIADFLSAIDDKISAVSAQIDQMQDFKKGLLQLMFV